MMLFIVCLLAFSVVAGANASPDIHTAQVSLTSGNWLQALTVPQFNKPGYDLYSVEVTLLGYVQGDMGFENRDMTDATVEMHLKADLELQFAGLSLDVSPTVRTVDWVGVYDGKVDFEGTSGVKHENLYSQEIKVWTSPEDADLSPFIGAGDLAMQARSIGKSYGTGPGKLTLYFDTETAADVTVKYYYNVVPEPSGMIALLSGVGGFYGFVRLRRRK